MDRIKNEFPVAHQSFKVNIRILMATVEELCDRASNTFLIRTNFPDAVPPRFLEAIRNKANVDGIESAQMAVNSLMDFSALLEEFKEVDDALKSGNPELMQAWVRKHQNDESFKAANPELELDVPIVVVKQDE